MSDLVDKPSGWRLLAGFVLAPAPPALLASAIFFLLSGVPDPARIWEGFLVALVFFGYLPALFVGLPTYAVLRRKLRPTMLNCVVAGAFVAALPLALISVFPFARDASSNGEPTVVDGRPTWFGFVEAMKVVGFVAGFGALGGGVFRLVAAPRLNPRP
jgi:hypothetical protein